MTANVKNNESMMYVGAKPWHGLGTEVPADQKLTVKEGLSLSGQDWLVGLEPLYCVTGEVGALSVGQKAPAQAVRRLDNQTLLGVVGPKYQPLQNFEAFDFFNSYIEQDQCRFHTAGVLGEGERVWILAKINRDPMEIVKGDIVEKFLLLSNSHDGTLAVRVGFTPIRVVCQNTLAMAHSSDASKLIRIKHTKRLNENLGKIKEVIDLANQQFEATAEQYRLLATKSINQKDLEKYVRVALGVPEKEDGTIATRSQNIMGDVFKLFENGQGANLESVKGTYWGAYNAVTEYFSYQAGRTTENRLNSLWFGPNFTKNNEALSVAVEMAQAA